MLTNIFEFWKKTEYGQNWVTEDIKIQEEANMSSKSLFSEILSTYIYL